MKTLRYSLYGLLILVLLVVTGVAVFVATFDANRYKSEIESLVLKHTGQALKIDGDVSITLYPKLGAVISQASLSGPNAQRKDTGSASTNKPFLTLRSTRLSMVLWPLLKGKVLIDGIEIEGLTLRLVRSNQGMLNVDDLINHIQPRTTTTATQAIATNDKPLTIDIQSVNIKDSGLVFIDELSQQRWDFSDIAVSTGRLAPDANGQLVASLRLQTSLPFSDSTIEFKSQYQLALAQQRMTLTQAHAKAQGQWQNVDALRGELTFGAQADWGAGLYRFDSIDARATTATNHTVAKTQTLSAKAQTDQLTFSAQAISGQAINLFVDTTQSKQRINTQIALPNWQWQDQALKLERVGVDLVLTDASISPTPIVMALSGPFEIDLKQSTIKSALSGEFITSPLQFSVTVNGLKQPAIDFDAHLQTLDFTKLSLAGSASGTQNKGLDQTLPENPQTPADPGVGVIDFSVLHGYQAKGQLRIDTIKTRTTQASALNTAIDLNKGRLTIGPHRVEIWGGQISGLLVIDANTQRIKLDETIQQVDIALLLKSLSATDALAGRGNLTTNMSAKGVTREAMLKSLTGQLELKLKDGAVKGVDLQAILRAARSTLGKAPTQTETTDGQTRFAELTATATIRNGVADNQDLSIKAPLFRVQGSGAIDIAAGQLNYLARVAVVESADGQGGAERHALRGVTVPVRLTGPISEPKYRIDIAALAAELAKIKHVDKAKDRINKIIPGLGDTLKGLFGH